MYAILAVLLLCPCASANFHAGDFVQMSRRGQFRQQRTTWHDLQGRHCPRFNVDTRVAIPIHKPKDYDELDEYKMQLSLDHGRLFSAWVTILAKPDAPGAGIDLFHAHRLTDDVLIPYVHVQLWKREDTLLKMRVDSRRLPEAYMKEHPEIVAEYRNRDQWPKHVLVTYHLQIHRLPSDAFARRYEWRSLDEVDAERGLLVLIYGGVAIIMVMMVGVALTARDKIAEFFSELTTEGLQTTTSATKEEGKAQ